MHRSSCTTHTTAFFRCTLERSDGICRSTFSSAIEKLRARCSPVRFVLQLAVREPWFRTKRLNRRYLPRLERSLLRCLRYARERPRRVCAAHPDSENEGSNLLWWAGGSVD